MEPTVLRSPHPFGGLDRQRTLKLDAKCNLLLIIIGLVSGAQTILQMMFFNYSRNYIYFVSTALLGPFQLIAVFLAFCISKYAARFFRSREQSIFRDRRSRSFVDILLILSAQFWFFLFFCNKLVVWDMFLVKT